MKKGLAKNAVELDWWDEFEFKGLKIIFTPTQHFSGRWLNDSNESLWGGYVVVGSRRFYFAGDTGYFFGDHDYWAGVESISKEMKKYGMKLYDNENVNFKNWQRNP